MPDDDLSTSDLQRIEALESALGRLEQELNAAKLSNQRLSVQQALMDDRLLTLERNRLFRLWGKVYRGAARLYGSLGLSRRYGGLSDLRTPGDYARQITREQHVMEAEDHRGAMARWRSRPLISVVLTDGAEAARSLRSVVDQCYPNWELCVPAPLQQEIADSRIHTADPSGEFVVTLHAGDLLSPYALYFFAQALQDHSLSLVYADEDCLDRHGQREAPLFKPGWSPELLRTTPYLGRALLYRRGTTPGADSRARHIPHVLYHRSQAVALDRATARYTARYTAPAEARISILICSRQARQLRECLAAIRYTAQIPVELLVVHHLDAGPGDQMRQTVEESGGIWIPYRGPFDFARMNNLAAGKATSPYLLFLNDDVIVQEAGWGQAMAATLARTEIGAAGVHLQYPNGTVQHAGVVMGMGDAAGHCGRFQRSSELWPWLRMTRDVSAVTGAMLGIRSQLFQQLKGFDEQFPVNYNDVDLCLRVREAGLRVVCLDAGKVIHRESQTRVGGTRYEEREAFYKRWAKVLQEPDEFYSPHLAPGERIALATGKNPLKQLGIP
jgi:GT2 family glycosyltransferase